jgi:hypothetical protein
MTAESAFSDASDACDAFSGYPPTRARVDAYTEIASHPSLNVAGRQNARATAEVSASNVRRARRDPPGEIILPHPLSQSPTL